MDNYTRLTPKELLVTVPPNDEICVTLILPDDTRVIVGYDAIVQGYEAAIFHDGTLASGAQTNLKIGRVVFDVE